MTSDQLHALADKIFTVSNDAASTLVRLFLVQDMIDSLKVRLDPRLFATFPFYLPCSFLLVIKDSFKCSYCSIFLALSCIIHNTPCYLPGYYYICLICLCTANSIHHSLFSILVWNRSVALDVCRKLVQRNDLPHDWFVAFVYKTFIFDT